MSTEEVFEVRIVVRGTEEQAVESLDAIGVLLDGRLGADNYGAVLYQGIALSVYEQLFDAGVPFGDYVAPEVMRP